MIFKSALHGFGNAAQDAYNQTYYQTGSASQSEAAARNAGSQTNYYAPTPVVTNAPAPAPIPVATPTPTPVAQEPTRQTIQPVTNTAEVVTTAPPPVIAKQAEVVNPLIPNVSYSSNSGQYSLTQTEAGAGVEVPPEYLSQEVVATTDAPVVSSGSIPWGLLLSLGAAAYESFKK